MMLTFIFEAERTARDLFHTSVQEEFSSETA